MNLYSKNEEDNRIHYDDVNVEPLTFFVVFQLIFFVFLILFSFHLNHFLIFQFVDELHLDPIKNLIRIIFVN
jgi:hypothetical protein